jgi:hypothetical protein
VIPDWKLDHRFSLVWEPAQAKTRYRNPREVKLPYPGQVLRLLCPRFNTTINKVRE